MNSRATLLHGCGFESELQTRRGPDAKALRRHGQRRTKFGEYRNIQEQVSKKPEEVCLLLCFLWQPVIECAVFFLTPTA
jgi:hypothetical protein